MSEFRKIPVHAQKVYDGVLHSVYHWKQELFDGSFTTFEALYRKPSVTVLAVTQDKKLLIVHEDQPYNGSYVTVPGGVAESDDVFEEARRELLEETGYKAGSLEVFEVIDVVDYSKLEWKSHFIIARNCQRVLGIQQDAGEHFVVRAVDFDTFSEVVLAEDFAIDHLRRIVSDPERCQALRTRLGL